MTQAPQEQETTKEGILIDLEQQERMEEDQPIHMVPAQLEQPEGILIELHQETILEKERKEIRNDPNDRDGDQKKKKRHWKLKDRCEYGEHHHDQSNHDSVSSSWK